MAEETLVPCTDVSAQELLNLDGVTLFHVPDLSGPPPAPDPETLLKLRHDLELLAGVER